MNIPSMPLAGVRVLDFTRVLAGPFCTMLLADLGADVIKIEEPRQGDETRQWGPPWAGEGEDALSAYYLCANRNKRSLTLDLKRAEGQQIARALAAQAQVVIENFKPGGMASYGLGYAALRAENPALVYCSITGFGQTGPYAARPGYDFIIQAMSGLMSITGPADGTPYKVGVAVADVLAGLFALSSILAALRYAERTGIGQQLDVSLLDASIAALVNVASNALVSGETPVRYGNAHPNIVPYQTFEAADGAFALGVGNDRQFAALCAILKRPDLAADPRYATNPARVEHREHLTVELAAVFRTRPAHEWVDACLAQDIPCGPLNDIQAILHDAHVRARGLVQPIALDNGVQTEIVGMPVRFSETPTRMHLPPPLHGAHTRAILAEYLGLSDAEIDALAASGVV